jgi:hypothetical protein
MMERVLITSTELFKMLIWANSPFFLPAIKAAPSVHTPTQTFHNSSSAMKKSFHFTNTSSPAVLSSSG